MFGSAFLRVILVPASLGYDDLISIAVVVVMARYPQPSFLHDNIIIHCSQQRHTFQTHASFL